MWRTEDDLQQMLRGSAAAWAADAAGPETFRQFRASGRGFDPAMWAEMAALGWTGILLPEDKGGSGLGIAPALTLAEIFGRNLVAAPFIPAAVVSGTILARAAGEGTELAQALAEGQAAPLPAFRESATGLGANAPATEYRDGRLFGRKLFVPGWHEGAELLVSAQSGGKQLVALVQPAAAGLTTEARAMADGTLTADLNFDGVPARPILTGPAAEEALSRAQAHEALALSAMLEGLAAQLFEMTVDYVKSRVQFDKPLASFQVLRHALVDLHTQIELAGASWRRAARALDEGLPSAAQRIAAARARAARAAHGMGQAAIQYHGAFGYTEEADVGLYVNAILRLAAQGGSRRTHGFAALARHKEAAHANA